ncbi:MAG TPA: MmgE/PrpD family protein, partial [Alphaproteobacteria bacterium]|nr:MmgE/PrpD family protein [Alphaproteobacteria bacterium]
GARFEIMDTHIKKWPIGSPIQAPLEALETLMKGHALGPRDIAAIEAHVPAVEADIVDSRAMPDICLQYLFAVMLIDGGVGFENSHDYARMKAPDVTDLTERISLVSDKSLPRREGRVSLTTRDGRTLSHHVPHVRGTTANPMDRDEVAAKAVDLIQPILGKDRTDQLVEAVWTLERLDDTRDLAPLIEA